MLFEGLQIGQQVIDLVRIELERRHCRVTGFDAFGQSLAECFDRVTQMQGSEWWRDLERTLSHLIDGMAPRAIVERKRFAALFGRRHGQRRTYHEERKTNLAQMNLHRRASIFASLPSTPLTLSLVESWPFDLDLHQEIFGSFTGIEVSFKVTAASQFGS